MKKFFSGRKILVTGGAGFIGSHLCEMLTELGATVTTTVRNKQHIPHLHEIQKKIAVKEVNLLDQNKVRSLLKNYSIIIHAAAVDGGTLFKRTHADKIFHENVSMTMNVFDILKKGNVEKVLFVSTAEVYTNLKNKNGIKEEQFKLFEPEKPEQWYAFSKMIGEYTAQLLGKTFATQVIIARPANIYGLRDDLAKNRLVPTILHAITRKESSISLGGTGKDVRSFLHVKDYVHNLLQLIETSTGGTYNLAGERPTSIENFVKHFARQSKLKITFSEKTRQTKMPNSRFLLDISKIKKLIPVWHDTPYEHKIKEMLEQL